MPKKPLEFTKRYLMMSERVKVCIITTVHQPFDTRIFHKEARTLAEAGYQVALIAQHDKDEIVDGIKIIALPKPKNRFSRIFLLNRRAYKIALMQNADIYHFHDPEFLPWAKKLRYKKQAKVVYDIHEDYPAEILTKHWIPKYFRLIVAWAFNKLEKIISKELNSLITVSPKIETIFREYEIKNITIVTNYPLMQYFPQQNSLKKDMINNCVNLIYVGGLTLVRGIKEIVQSLEYLSYDNVKLILIGSFVEKGFKSELEILPGWDKVEYKGWMAQQEAYLEMQKADIGLLCLLPTPNHIYSVPNKLFEYMAAGIPVIASYFDYFKEVITQNKCGICVNPKDPKDIAKAIDYLINHPEEGKIMGENGKKAVLEKYNWETESKKLITLYEELSKNSLGK